MCKQITDGDQRKTTAAVCAKEEWKKSPVSDVSELNEELLTKKSNEIDRHKIRYDNEC